VISSFSAGGAELLVKDLCVHMAKNDLDVECWALSASNNNEFEKDFINYLKSQKVTVMRFNKPTHKNRYKIIRKLRNIIKQNKPDIINTHLEHITFFTLIAALGFKIPIIQTIHNTRVQYPLLQRTFARAFLSKFVAISKRTQEIYIQNIGIPTGKIKLIYNGIVPERFKRKKKKKRLGIMKIIAVGRLTEQKDHKTLIAAYYKLIHSLKDEHKDLPELNIVGDGVLRPELMRYVSSLGINKHVKFLGVRQDIPELLASSDLYIMSSRWEGFSISLLEALASEILIIATDVGSNNEIIKNGVNGILVEPGNPSHLFEAMYRITSDNQLRESFEINNKIFPSLFSIDTCVNKYIELYNEIIKA
jgi:L-malate glycosyltransferase